MTTRYIAAAPAALRPGIVALVKRFAFFFVSQRVYTDVINLPRRLPLLLLPRTFSSQLGREAAAWLRNALMVMGLVDMVAVVVGVVTR